MSLGTLHTLHVRRPGLIDRGVEIDATIMELLSADSPVAVGVSGGKDSCAAAIATVEHLAPTCHRAQGADRARACGSG